MRVKTLLLIVFSCALVGGVVSMIRAFLDSDRLEIQSLVLYIGVIIVGWINALVDFVLAKAKEGRGTHLEFHNAKIDMRLQPKEEARETR